MRLSQISFVCGLALFVPAAVSADDAPAAPPVAVDATPMTDDPSAGLPATDVAPTPVADAAVTDLADTPVMDGPEADLDATAIPDAIAPDLAETPVADAADLTDMPVADAPATGEGSDLTWDQFDDPDFAPSASDASPSAADAPSTAGVTLDPNGSAARTSAGVVLGPQGVDDLGRAGRLHTVAPGDTLWDLAAAYLGTPWVWPSVWIDNDDIANPHLISPGDKIWITANEMRVVTAEEAESFLTPVEEETVAAMAPALFVTPVDEEPVAVAETPPLAALESSEDDPSTLDAFPVAIPGQEPQSMPAGRMVTIASRHSYGFVSADDLEGASSIVESPSERTFLAAGDTVYLGMGEGDAEVGDEFMIFRVDEPVRDVETNRIIGHHVENLGWAKVRELTGDTSIAEIRESFAEIPRGAKIVARPKVSRKLTLRATPDAIEGQVVYLPRDQTLMADGGWIYLNRGEFHGIEVGSELEVFDSGRVMNERERRVDVRTPDRPIAILVVVTVDEDSSVAFVLSAKRELEVGDTVRPAALHRMAQR